MYGACTCQRRARGLATYCVKMCMVGAEGRSRCVPSCTCARRVRLLRYRRRCWWCGLTVCSALLAGLLYDHFVLSRRSGSRLLPLFMLGLSCPPGVAVLANMSLLDGRQADLLAAAARNERVERRFRRHDGTAAILFLHFHKAGGTSFCAAAGANRAPAASLLCY